MKFYTLLATASLCSFAATSFGAPPAPRSLGKFVDQVAKKTGASPEEVREKMVESIRETGNFTGEDLRRIRGGDEIDLSPARQNELISLVQDSAAFRVSVGLEAMRLKSIQTEVENAFDRIAKIDSRDELKKAFILYRAAELKNELVFTTAAAIRTKLDAKGGRDEVLYEQLKKNAKDRHAAVAELVHARNSLFYATTSYLTRSKIPFSLAMEGSQPVIRIESAEVPANVSEVLAVLQGAK